MQRLCLLFTWKKTILTARVRNNPGSIILHALKEPVLKIFSWKGLCSVYMGDPWKRLQLKIRFTLIGVLQSLWPLQSILRVDHFRPIHDTIKSTIVATAFFFSNSATRIRSHIPVTAYIQILFFFYRNGRTLCMIRFCSIFFNKGADSITNYVRR